MMNILVNAASFSKFALALLIVAGGMAAALTASSFILRKKRKLPAVSPDNRQEHNDPRQENLSNLGQSEINLLKYPKHKIVKPFVPRPVTLWGIAGFFAACSGVYLALISTGISYTAILAIGFFLGVAIEVGVSNIVYTVKVKTDENIVFVPRISGVDGKVSVAIPASKTGQGKVRLVYKGLVTEITALSLDEVTLAPGTDITVLYAWKDDCVMVKKK